MRRDPALILGNPNGTNLWMLYSHPEVQINQTYGTASQMVEIHLAPARIVGRPGSMVRAAALHAGNPHLAVLPLAARGWSARTVFLARSSELLALFER